METLKGVLKRGRTVWDHWLLPDDEFVIRVTALRNLMEELELDACVIVGSTDAYADLAYFTNFVPPLYWATALFHRDGSPTLIAGLGGGREFPFYSTLTWVRDLRWYPSHGIGVATILRERRLERGRVGLVGLADTLPTSVAREFEEALAQHECLDITDRVRELRLQKSPRELIALRRAQVIAQSGLAAAASTYLEGRAATSAVLAAEEAVRRAGARDVRILANLWEPTELCPYDPPLSPCPSWPLTFYVAAEYQGYWGEAAGTFTFDKHPLMPIAHQALAEARECLCTSGSTSEAWRAAMRVLQQLPGDAIVPEIGTGIGLSLREPPILEPNSDEVLRERVVVSLRIHLRDRTWPALVVDSVVVGDR